MNARMHFPEWIRPEIIAGLPFRWYGLMYVIAFAITYWLFLAEAKRKWERPDGDLIASFFSWSILGLLIGARVVGTLVYDPDGYYLANPWQIFWPFDSSMRFVGFQGMSYHGGIIGLVIAMIVFAKRKRIDLPEWIDIVAVTAPIGYTFGRFGNFINGELYGRATASPIGMIFPNAERLPLADPRVSAIAQNLGITSEPGSAAVNLPRFPSQLFEAFFEGFILWLVMWFIVRKLRVKKGFAVGAYLAGYGTIRFVLEYFREPDTGMNFPLAFGDPTAPNYLLVSFLNFTTGQIFCAVMVAAGITIMALRRQGENQWKRQ